MICINQKGDVFLDFQEIREERIPAAKQIKLTHSLIIIKHQDQFLLVYNKFRKKWELPGGMIEDGEDPRSCAKRELLEETGQIPEKLNIKGLMKFKLQLDKRIEWGALYSGKINKIKKFTENKEIEKIQFWDGASDIGYIDEIDFKLLEYY